MFWIVYVLICICELCLDIVFYLEYSLFHNSHPMFVCISSVILFVFYIFCFPLILLTVKGYGLITGVPAVKSIDKLVYIPTLVSLLLLLIFILIPWGKMFNITR